MFAWYGSSQSVEPQRPGSFCKRHSYSAKIDVIKSSRADEVSVCTISLLSDRHETNLRQFSPRARKFTRCATATPVGPYTSSDLIGSYNNDTSRLPSSNNIHSNKNGSNLTQRCQSYDVDRRPSSRSKDSKKNFSISSKGYDIDRERDIHERHKDGIQAVTNGHRSNYFKPLGLRNNNYLSGQSPSASHINPVTPAPTITRTPPQQQQQQQAIQSRDPDDLVAMGTNWNPNNGNSRSNGRPNSQSNNSLVYQMTQSNSVSTQASTTSSRRLASKAQNAASQGRVREQEPKYADPTSGAPPSLQQRVAEIAALEQDTIRWEKSRKVKKKPVKEF